jgi:hypothetical protein
MSINEMESRARELRQLQALIDEAQAEAEAIKDSLKAAMGDSEEVRENHLENRHHRQNRHHGLKKGPPRCGGTVQQDHHNPPLQRGMKKAPCINARQSQMQEAQDQPTQGRPVHSLYRPPA